MLGRGLRVNLPVDISEELALPGVEGIKIRVKAGGFRDRLLCILLEDMRLDVPGSDVG